MKRIIALLLLFVIVMLSAISCTTSEKSKIKIGIAAPDVTHGWVAGVAYYAEKYCKDNNITYKITTSSDAAEMASDLEDLVAWGADAIVAYPQWTGMESAIQEIVDKNIPVVNFDIDIDIDNGVYKVTGDNYGMGYKSAEYIVSRVGDAAHIAVMDVPSSGSISKLRKEGFYAYLTEIGYDTTNIFEVTCESYAREVALKNMSDVLLANPTIDAVFTYDDEMSLGCIQAISESGRADIKAITGGGGMQEYFRLIDDASYENLGPVSVLYSPMMIQDAIEAAIKICNGETVEKVITVPTTVISSENVKEYLDAENTIY